MVTATARPTAGRTSLLHGLLRVGAEIAVAPPTPAPDRAVDAAPIPPWRRIMLLAGFGPESVVQAPSMGRSQGLLERAARYVLLVPIIVRVVAMAITTVALVSAQGADGMGGVLIVTGASMLLNAIALVFVLRRPVWGDRSVWPWLAADASVALAMNLLVAAWTPRAHYVAATIVPWEYLSGTVALWTIAWGGLSGATIVVAAVPLQLAMNAVSAAQHVGEVAVLGSGVGAALWQVLVLLTTLLGLAILGIGTRLAMAAGIRAGREAERNRLMRGMHDTVLQTLEAMSLGSQQDRVEPAFVLADVRAQARSQARQMRRVLRQMSGDVQAGGLVDELTSVVAEMTALGLNTELVVGDIDSDVANATRIALRGAVREALRNVLKHSGQVIAVVNVTDDEDGVTIIVRDHGCGFDTSTPPSGFGTTNSIVARLDEVGGLATFTSTAGAGTRVTLWAPR